MKLKVLSLVAGSLIAGAVFAHENLVCPELSEIQKVKLNMVEEISTGSFITFALSQYNTKDEWAFFLAPIQAKNPQVALNIANSLLTTAVKGPGVEINPEVCTYQTSEKDLIAGAVYKPLGMSITKLKQVVNSLH